jgi:nucleotide-binding universal stress UspA family protein
MSFHIVVGVDGSDNAVLALKWAADEAKQRGDAHVTALYAWQLPLIGIPGAFDQNELEQEAKDLLNREIARAGLPDDVKVNPVVAQGDPAASLIAACDQFEAQMLVIGSRGRGGFKGLLLGSVSAQCSQHAHCPVLIVKDAAAVEVA